tara:strand:+ start:539 stop:739 length:201 start_codon:yes stop_codon:yes gene_type:complete
MKKSELKKIIKEEIKEISTKDGVTNIIVTCEVPTEKSMDIKNNLDRWLARAGADKIMIKIQKTHNF